MIDRVSLSCVSDGFTCVLPSLHPQECIYGYTREKCTLRQSTNFIAWHTHGQCQAQHCMIQFFRRNHHQIIQPVPPNSNHRPKSRRPLGEGVLKASGSVGETAGGPHNKAGRRPLSRPAKTDVQWGGGACVSNASAVLAAGHDGYTHCSRCISFALWQLPQHAQHCAYCRYLAMTTG